MSSELMSIEDVALGLGVSKGRVLELAKVLGVTLQDGAVPAHAFLRLEGARRKGVTKAPPIKQGSIK
jgi:hypothetical protein